MSKRTVFSTITPLPAFVTRQHVLETLHNHVEMIDLNPLVEERHLIKPPEKATPEEFHCVWYLVTDRVSYLPGGIASSKISYPACFHDLSNGIQTHIYAPMGLEIRGKWTLGGSLPGEPAAPVELGMGVPLQGLYVREDVDMRCNILMTGFVKKTLKKAHAELVQRLSVKAQLSSVKSANDATLQSQAAGSYSPPLTYAGSVHSSAGSPAFSPAMGFATPHQQHQMQGYMDHRQSLQGSMGYPMPSPPLGFSSQSPVPFGQQHFISELPNHEIRDGSKGKESASPVEMMADVPTPTKLSKKQK